MNIQPSDKPRKWLILLAAVACVITAIGLFANELIGQDEADIRYSEYLQSEMSQRPFLKRQWSAGKVEDTLKQASELEASKQTAAAIAVLSRYLEQDPEQLLVQWKRLRLISRTGTPLQISRATEAFLKLRPNFGPVLLARAEAEQQMHQLRLAENDFRRALNDPLLVKSDRVKAGRSLYHIIEYRGDHKAALAQLDQVLTDSPHDPDLILERARILETLGQLAEADSTLLPFNTLTRDKSLRAEAARMRVRLLQKLGKPTEALTLLESSGGHVYDGEQNWNEQLRLATLYASNNRPARALSYLVQANDELRTKHSVETNDQGYSYHTYLRTVADLALKQKRHDLAMSALEALEHGADSQSERFKWLVMLGTVAQGDKNYSAALDYFERALALREDRSTRLRAAEAAWKEGEFQKVINLLPKAIAAAHGSEVRENSRLRQRICEAHERARQYKQALQCTEKLLKQSPKDQKLMLSAANLAAKSGADPEKVNFLSTARSIETPSSKVPLPSAARQEQSTRQRNSEDWFREAYVSEKTFDAGYAYASSLLRGGKRDSAIIVLARLAGMKGNSDTNQYRALHALGYAMASNGDFIGASRAWAGAWALRPNPTLKLRRVWAEYSAGRLKQADDLLKEVIPSLMPYKEQLTWHELHGMILFDKGRYSESITAREYVARQVPTAKHFAQLAQSYQAAGRAADADNAYEEAIAVSRGDKTGYIMQRAALKLSANQFEAAQILLNQALSNAPETPEIEEELGYTYARLGRNDQALRYLKLASNHYQIEARSGRVGTTEAMLKRNKISRDIAKIQKGISLTVQHGGNLTKAKSDVGDAAALAPYRGTGTSLELSWQPPGIGYRDGRQFELFGGLFANTSDDKYLPRNKSLGARLGLRYKPLGEQNLWLSLERQFGIGDDVQDNTALRFSWNRASGNAWPLDDATIDIGGHSLYHEVMVDVTKMLENDDPTLAALEARLGANWTVNDNWMLTPHAYLRGRGEFGDDDAHIIDSGFGLSARQRGAYDFYEGYKAQGEWFARIGGDVENTQGKKETRATFGFRLNY